MISIQLKIKNTACISSCTGLATRNTMSGPGELPKPLFRGESKAITIRLDRVSVATLEAVLRDTISGPGELPKPLFRGICSFPGCSCVVYNFNAAKDPEEQGDPPCRCEHTLDKHVICQYYEENATIVPVTAGVLPVVLPSMQNSSPSHVHDRASSSSSASSSTMHTSVAAAKAMNANANTTRNADLFHKMQEEEDWKGA